MAAALTDKNKVEQKAEQTPAKQNHYRAGGFMIRAGGPLVKVMPSSETAPKCVRWPVHLDPSFRLVTLLTVEQAPPGT